jgi:hypothetical protein
VPASLKLKCQAYFSKSNFDRTNGITYEFLHIYSASQLILLLIMIELSLLKIMVLFYKALIICYSLNIAAIIGARIWDHRDSSLLQVMMDLVSMIRLPS